MKIKEEYKVREIAGEYVVIVQGSYGADMTKVIALNDSSLYLWESLEGEEFSEDDVASLLIERYEVEEDVAHRDAKLWVERLVECGLVA